MKRLAVFALVVWTLGGVVLAGEASKLEGSWEFVSGTFTTSEGTSKVTAEDRKAIKVLSATHFSMVGHAGDYKFGHAGRYTLKDGEYTEYMDVATSPDIEGRPYTFESKVEGDTWRISGKMENLGLSLEEVWRRVK
jgi:hypothetical protein